MANTWYLQFKGSGFGPLTVDEVTVIIKSGKLPGPLFAMGPGVAQWTLVDQVPELSTVNKLIQAVEEGHSKDKRKNARVPLLAIVRFQLGDKGLPQAATHLGICRDLSAGGMMVISQVIPEKPAELVRLEVVPEGQSPVSAFKVNGVVRQLSPDKNGFSVEFVDLNQKTAMEIQTYVASLKDKKK